MNKKYRTIYADPPWRFKNFSAKGEGRNAVSHYDCMSIEDICALPISDFAHDDCVLFLWAVDPLLHRAFEVIEAWGFQFKTVGFYWAKLNKRAPTSALSEEDFFCGLGYWTRANVEQCLLATRGNPSRKSRNVRRLILDHRREHSRKPDIVFDRIEKLVEGPYLELFSRQTRQGWDALGNQTSLFNDGGKQTRRRPSKSASDNQFNLELTTSPPTAKR